MKKRIVPLCKHPSVRVQIRTTDMTADTAWTFIVGKIQGAMADAGLSDDEIREFREDAKRCGDHRSLFRVATRYVTVVA